ncbi:LysR family transcriptional regulator [Halarcobacter ebronensis]|uniref:LysR family transcriptional regulator n=1 Tax=Halarcobacter ebronensis TaxID=1462615 RepID=A0A4Q1AQD2_9BACT|nr:LysR family transcriptional regulator [Halarcobacter ebronensis]QKF81570.1 transcriptional regulator, LysR family [Halarcobacter ebronensis]RXK05498.1 LysR family transcriptional regulator [Halarcobacter ebronensis]
MDSNLLKVFISVANTKSISQGAKELGFTQSNVTLRIKQLEKSLGYELFHRTNRGVVLSLEGQKFLPYAIDIVKKVEEATLKMRNIDHQELLRIGSTQSNATIRLSKFIDRLNEDFQDMKLEFVVDSSLNLIEQLLDYKLDIAFVNGDPKHKDLEVLNSFKEDIVLVESKEKEPQNTIYAYKNGCINRIYLEKYLTEEKKTQYKKVNLENYELILACVKAGYGVTLFSRQIIQKFGYENKLKITTMDFSLDTYLVCRKDYFPMIEDYLRKIEL